MNTIAIVYDLERSKQSVNNIESERKRPRRSPKAIALYGSRTGLAEEQAQPVLIVEGGAEFATADAVARRAVVAPHVQGHPGIKARFSAE